MTKVKKYNIKELEILFDIILKQTYQNIKEWIILTNDSIHDKLQTEFNIKYITNYNLSIKDLNQYVEGDIIIWMDCDSYYFENRIEYIVTLLKHNQITFTKNIYLHDIIFNKTFDIKTNNLYGLAYTKKCFENCSENKDIEEKILNYGINQQLENSLIKIVNGNEFRFEIIVSYLQELKDWNKLHDSIIEYLVPKDIYDRYRKLLVVEETLDYDIVYFTGGHGIEWDPTDKKLGGSEQAVVNLSENWVKMKKKVIVYGNFKNNKIVNNVEYVNWLEFPYQKKSKNLIAWRAPGIILLMNFEFKTDNLIVDFHDNFSYTLGHLNQKLLHNFFTKVNKYCFKSNYHKVSFEEFSGLKLENDKYDIILNGIRINSFNKNINNLVRNPYRFCYCSSYDRGLQLILEKIWPIIYNHQPKAELHVYYGMEHLYDQQYKTLLTLLMGQPGVMDHGRQPLDMIVREKYLSTFHIYLSNSIAEIDCISIRESLVTGCIPIISKFGVFKERDGIAYEVEPNNDELCKKIANDIIRQMENSKLIEEIRNKTTKSSLIIDWCDVAKEWLNKNISIIP